jgi:hypothetical protein
MSKRFIIILNSSTPEQDGAFGAYIKAKGLGWWHWLTNGWLLYSVSDDLTARQLRDDLKEIYPNVHMMVFELSSGTDTWSGLGPKEEGRDMFEWIRKYWESEKKASR